MSRNRSTQEPRDAGRAGNRRRLLILFFVADALVVGALIVYLLVRQAAPGADSLNVLLISLDTTRADHLGCYGHGESRTPNIDALSAEGVRFTQCTSVAPTTLPSHASLLTGMYPFMHGARVNGQFFLHPDNASLAEILQSAGFATGAVVGAMVLNREYGLKQGFEVYDDPREAQARRAKPGGPPIQERPASDISDRAVQFLRANRDRRFFLFLHYFDPHKPLQPPEPFRSAFADPYLGEIAYVDQQIGRVRRELEALGLLDRTLIVLTADHGEGRGEHGEENHGLFVYDTTLRIPLIARLPGIVPAGRTIDAQVRLIDVAPTILRWVGIEAPEGMQGEALQPLIEGADRTDRVAYAETLAPRFDYGYAPLRALRAEGWKYILGPEPELYDLRSDPKELTNVHAAHPERAAEMRRRLAGLLSAAKGAIDPDSARRAAGPEERRGLQGLGYAGSADADEGAAEEGASDLERYPPEGLSPMRYAEEIEYVNDCVSMILGGRYAEAEAKLRTFLQERQERSEGLYNARKWLAHSLDAQGRSEEAVAYYEQAVSERPTDVMTRTDLGITLRRARRINESVEALRAALSYPLKLPYTRVQLAGSLFLLGGHDEEALEEIALALAEDENIAEAWGLRGRIEARRNNRAAAVAALRRAVELNPGNTAWRKELSELEGSRSSKAP